MKVFNKMVIKKSYAYIKPPHSIFPCIKSYLQQNAIAFGTVAVSKQVLLKVLPVRKRTKLKNIKPNRLITTTP